MTNTPTKELKQIRWFVLFLLLLSCVLWSNTTLRSTLETSTFLPLHIALETATIVIFTSVFIVCWNAFDATRKKNNVILAIAFLCAAIFGLFHAITFQGMPGFLDAIDMHKSLSFWLLSRYIVGITLFRFTIKLDESHISTSKSLKILALGLLLTFIISYAIFYYPKIVPLTYLF